jgi:Uncharacterized membrane protein, required for colicin V production
MGSLPFTVLDLAILATVLISAVFAFGRGFVHETLSIASWVGAALAVVFGLPIVRPYAVDLIQPPTLATVAAGVAIFILAMIALSIFTRALAARVQGSSLNAIDRSLGFVFGLARGAVLVCLAYIPVQWLMTPPEQPGWLQNARLLPLLEKGSGWIAELVDHALGTTPGTDTARERDQKLQETERMVRGMMSPDPKAPSGKSDNSPKGYDERERREIERLLEGNR